MSKLNQANTDMPSIGPQNGFLAAQILCTVSAVITAYVTTKYPRGGSTVNDASTAADVSLGVSRKSFRALDVVILYYATIGPAFPCRSQRTPSLALENDLLPSALRCCEDAWNV